MCKSCHKRLSDAEVLQTIRAAVEHPEFHFWNSTSVSHMKYAALGVNGEEVRDLALRLYLLFVEWLEASPNGARVLLGFDKEPYVGAVVRKTYNLSCGFRDDDRRERRTREDLRWEHLTD